MPAPTHSPHLTLRLSGAFRADGAGGELDGLPRRGQALLAYLSQQRDMRAERGFLADLLWSDRAEEQARASLRQELSVLRRALPEGVLGASRQHVWLDPARVRATAEPGEAFLQGFDLPSEGFEDWLRTMRMGGADPGPEPAALRPRTQPTLAVLPFEELGAPETDMFSDGVVEEITGALSRVHDFDVIARQSAYALQGERHDAPAAARLLGADYLVEGSVRRAGDRVRIAVQLVNGIDGHTLWSERFDDRLDDLFGLQDRIAAQVAGQVSPSLRRAEIERAGTRPPADRTAYDLLLSALPHFWSHDRADNARAIELFDSALAHDPAYAHAMAMKAWALAQQCVYMWSADPRADRRQAVELAESAASLITDHTGTLVAIAAALTNASDDTSRGMPFVERALAIDPSNAWAWMRRGWLYVYEGDPEPALAAFDRAERLSPLDPFRFNICFGKAAAMRFCAGREAEALPLIEQGIAMNPRAKWALRLLVAAYYTIGRTDEANRTAREMLESYPNLTISYMRAALADTAFHRAGGYYEIFSNLGVPEN